MPFLCRWRMTYRWCWFQKLFSIHLPSKSFSLTLHHLPISTLSSPLTRQISGKIRWYPPSWLPPFMVTPLLHHFPSCHSTNAILSSHLGFPCGQIHQILQSSALTRIRQHLLSWKPLALASPALALTTFYLPGTPHFLSLPSSCTHALNVSVPEVILLLKWQVLFFFLEWTQRPLFLSLSSICWQLSNLCLKSNFLSQRTD